MTATTTWRRSTARRRQPSVHPRHPRAQVYVSVAGLGVGVVAAR